MPAGAIGSCWAEGSWDDTAWEAGAWADAAIPTPTPEPVVIGGYGGFTPSPTTYLDVRVSARLPLPRIAVDLAVLDMARPSIHAALPVPSISIDLGFAPRDVGIDIAGSVMELHADAEFEILLRTRGGARRRSNATD